jgi:4-hydroxy-tetrahydrodipicolinate synthase
MGFEYRGILPAMQLPFDASLAIDEQELRRLTRWLAGHKGIGGLVTNGHTGEVFALTAKRRAEATRIVADEVKGGLPVVSGICCEGISEAVEHAQMAREAGASALLVMPPHQWLRFGMKQPDNVIDFFAAIGEASGLDLIVHIYPAWTRASYSFETLAVLAKLPWVKSMKVGTRDMNKYARDLDIIRQADPSVTVLTCHDEYLLPSMVQGVDGALVGFGSFLPQMIIDLYAAVCAGDLKQAMAIQARINPLKDVGTAAASRPATPMRA